LEKNNIHCSVTMGEKRYRLRLSSKSFKSFYDFIGDCPVDCYDYKWEITRNYPDFLKGSDNV
jgi:hypothetical protein